jgi:hypothetical protein
VSLDKLNRGKLVGYLGAEMFEMPVWINRGLLQTMKQRRPFTKIDSYENKKDLPSSDKHCFHK